MNKKEMLNKVQRAAYELIQSDARFVYALTDVCRNAKGIETNYMMMSQPYIGVFSDGAEQWCRKVGFQAPQFNEIEKEYYTILRGRHKLYELSYEKYKSILISELNASEKYFYSKRRWQEIVFGYYNVGVDMCEDEFCGNTILCSLYTPFSIFGNEHAGQWMKSISIIAGELAGYFEGDLFPVYKYNMELDLKPKDYHFYNNCPLKEKNELYFLLFSILCSINYVICFIEKFFEEELPQKFKYAYLQYYYLCDFIKEINTYNGLNLMIDVSLQDRKFRNCLAHYGLGQYLREDEIVKDDLLMGLTIKAFSMEYLEAKEFLYRELQGLVKQIKEIIF